MCEISPGFSRATSPGLSIWSMLGSILETRPYSALYGVLPPTVIIALPQKVASARMHSKGLFFELALDAVDDVP